MTTFRSDRIDPGTIGSTANGDTAADSAENQGMRVVGLQGKAGPSLFDRMSVYLKEEYASLKQGRHLTLEQLLASLGMATDGDRLLHQQSAALRLLMASDIKDARDFPIPGVPSAIARPMRAWRQRYNGLGRFLPRTS